MLLRLRPTEQLKICQHPQLTQQQQLPAFALRWVVMAGCKYNSLRESALKCTIRWQLPQHHHCTCCSLSGLFPVLTSVSEYSKQSSALNSISSFLIQLSDSWAPSSDMNMCDPVLPVLMGCCLTLFTFPLAHVPQLIDEMFLRELQGHRSVYLRNIHKENSWGMKKRPQVGHLYSYKYMLKKPK